MNVADCKASENKIFKVVFNVVNEFNVVEMPNFRKYFRRCPFCLRKRDAWNENCSGKFD